MEKWEEHGLLKSSNLTSTCPSRPVPTLEPCRNGTNSLGWRNSYATRCPYVTPTCNRIPFPSVLPRPEDRHPQRWQTWNNASEVIVHGNDGS